MPNPAVDPSAKSTATRAVDAVVVGDRTAFEEVTVPGMAETGYDALYESFREFDLHLSGEVVWVDDYFLLEFIGTSKDCGTPVERSLGVRLERMHDTWLVNEMFGISGTTTVCPS